MKPITKHDYFRLVFTGSIYANIRVFQIISTVAMAEDLHVIATALQCLAILGILIYLYISNFGYIWQHCYIKHLE